MLVVSASAQGGLYREPGLASAYHNSRYFGTSGIDLLTSEVAVLTWLAGDSLESFPSPRTPPI